MTRKDRDYWGWFRQVLFFRNSGGRFCDVAALLPALALSLASAVASVEVATEASEEAGKAAAPAKVKVEVLARFSYAKLSVGMNGVGIEGAYSRSTHYGLGVELKPHGRPDTAGRCFSTARHWRAIRADLSPPYSST